MDTERRVVVEVQTRSPTGFIDDVKTPVGVTIYRGGVDDPIETPSYYLSEIHEQLQSQREMLSQVLESESLDEVDGLYEELVECISDKKEQKQKEEKNIRRGRHQTRLTENGDIVPYTEQIVITFTEPVKLDKEIPDDILSQNRLSVDLDERENLLLSEYLSCVLLEDCIGDVVSVEGVECSAEIDAEIDELAQHLEKQI